MFRLIPKKNVNTALMADTLILQWLQWTWYDMISSLSFFFSLGRQNNKKKIKLLICFQFSFTFHHPTFFFPLKTMPLFWYFVYYFPHPCFLFWSLLFLALFISTLTKRKQLHLQGNPLFDQRDYIPHHPQFFFKKSDMKGHKIFF